MAKKGKRIIVSLECPVCHNRNYVTKKNPENTKEKLVLKKFCRFCRKVAEHKEVKI